MNYELCARFGGLVDKLIRCTYLFFFRGIKDRSGYFHSGPALLPLRPKHYFHSDPVPIHTYLFISYLILYTRCYNAILLVYYIGINARVFQAFNFIENCFRILKDVIRGGGVNTNPLPPKHFLT